ncbi:MAG TPA: class I SAM-dependent methyltransferase [Longimicrobiaceae bacterium]|nr:class I SAM-dependent methyltransferase [Longimicrobiaceae bacterium]
MSIQNVSDTARWVAVYRAMETERADAHFRDPFARRLAGERGEAIVRQMPQGRRMAWAMVVRTQVMDEEILEAVRTRGADMVINLAAGLDARPWRLDLPPTLRWVDVDLPGILTHKAEVMAGEEPRCRYEAVHADLADPAQRDAVLQRLGESAQSALVVSEGLLIYLAPDDVAALADALHRQPSFRWWLTDLASPKLLEWMTRTWGKQVGAGNAPFRFAPEAGSGYFEAHGWRELIWRSTMDEARRLRRQPLQMRIGALWMPILPRAWREGWRRFSGYLLLERI